MSDEYLENDDLENDELDDTTDDEELDETTAGEESEDVNDRSYNRCIENCAEWLVGDKRITCTFSERKMANKIRKLAEKYPDEVIIKCINTDNSVLASIPRKWLKISPTRSVNMSDERKQFLAEQMRNARERKKQKESTESEE